MDVTGAERVVYADGLAAMTDGRAAALRLELAVTEAHMTVEAGQPGVTVTAVWVGDGRIRILADGVFSGDAVCRVGGGGTVEIAGADGCGYVWGEDGVETFALTVRREGGTERDEKTAMPEEPTVTGDTDPAEPFLQTAGETPPPDAPAQPDETEAATMSKPWAEASREGRYIGCRETAVREGTYAVQFLFTGVGTVPNTVPESCVAPCRAVICVEGGGVIEVEDRWDGHGACTFMGLRETGRYRFWVYDSRNVIEVVYEDGRFVEQYAKQKMNIGAFD